MNAGTIRTEIELLFRRESGRLTAVLTRILGPHNLSLAEDVVQESFIAALDHWSAGGIPDNAPAWLLTTARRRAIDLIRRSAPGEGSLPTWRCFSTSRRSPTAAPWRCSR
jgi:RNA polymerase sigma-70 factor (ECF subfamily)